MYIYIYIWKSYLWSAELYEGRSSHLRTELLQLQKESRKENSGLYAIRTPYFCDTSAPLYQLSYQPNWEHYICWFFLPNLWPLCLSQGLLNVGQTPTSNWEPCAQNLVLRQTAYCSRTFITHLKYIQLRDYEYWC